MKGESDEGSICSSIFSILLLCSRQTTKTESMQQDEVRVAMPENGRVDAGDRMRGDGGRINDLPSSGYDAWLEEQREGEVIRVKGERELVGVGAGSSWTGFIVLLLLRVLISKRKGRER